MTNFERFAEAYRRNIRRARERFPDQYVWPIEQVEMIADRMLAAVQRGSANKDSHAFKWTCKELGIKHTYKAINKFIKQESSNAQVTPL